MLLPLDIADRRAATAPGTSLGAIADGLTRELAPWLAAGLPIPEQKARLTRDGGRCPVHGTLLEFDPGHPHEHRCLRCQTSYTGTAHHGWWAMGAHLFTAERAVHAAALFLLRGNPLHRDLAQHTLRALAEQYAHWPNRDNVLGPTRPFFSTYLESIWLLNICHALALLEQGGETHVGEVVRERILEPSSALIASFHEGRSNRQVWNEVALLSAWTLLGNHVQAERRATGESSLRGLLANGLLDDGTWYEGENYHQFAHRGLWYGVQWWQSRGMELPPALVAKYREGFVTPFAGLLPDETLPSRRDSQYAVSVRQWRWAEWCELGYAAHPDPRLAAMLRRLYDGDAPVGDTGRAHSTADAERNRPPVVLSRGDCSWRALLMASPDPAPLAGWPLASVVQPQQGLAVLRREGARVYVALEGGVHGGGHGHPDRLALTLQTERERWLDDPGTGSYVEQTLHWYRSTLAHHAPLINGASQSAGTAMVTAFEDRGGAGWIQKCAPDLAPGVSATRTVVVCDGYLVDLLEWTANTSVTLTLPVATGQVTNVTDWSPYPVSGAGALEDGFEFLSHTERAGAVPATVCIEAEATGPRAEGLRPTRLLRAWYAASGSPLWWRGIAPGAPGCSPASRTMVQVEGASGRIVGVWSWSEPGEAEVMASQVALSVATLPVASVTTRDGTVSSHEPAPHGWHIGLVARHSRSSIDLEGVQAVAAVPSRSTAPETTRVQRTCRVPLLARTEDILQAGAVMPLGETAYRQTEESWGGTNRPEAVCRLGATASDLIIHVECRTGHPPVVPEASSDGSMPANPLDNERADVNADGLQCYLGTMGQPVGQWHQAVLSVPRFGGDARTTALVPGGVVPQVTSDQQGDGWSLTLSWPRHALPDGPISMDLVINERPPERERRRGQLVLSGGGGFAYLRGDRHTPHTLLELVLP